MSEKQRAATTTRPASKARPAAARPRKKLSAEHRAKISQAKKGRKNSAEHNKKIAAAKKGKPRDAATKAKIAATMRGRKQDPEHVKNKGESRRRTWATKTKAERQAAMQPARAVRYTTPDAPPPAKKKKARAKK